MEICKVKDLYIVGIPHVLQGYIQEVVVVYNKGDKWTLTIAEHYKTGDKEISSVLKNLMYSTTEEDFETGIEKSIGQGVRVQRIDTKGRWTLPFPKSLVEGKVKIQKEVD